MSQASPADQSLDAKGMRFAIAATRWNNEIVEQLIAGAQRALAARGAGNVRVHRCAGAFELGPLSARLARKGGIDGLIAIGCLIRGGTDHYTLLANEVTRALGSLSMELATSPQPLAVAFGVLTCDTLAQAQERADLKGADKGGEVALACIEQIHALKGAD